MEDLGRIIRFGWPQALAEGAELLVRVAISHGGLPRSLAGMTSASIARPLSPYIERVLDDAEVVERGSGGGRRGVCPANGRPAG